MISTQNALRSQISEFYEYCRRTGYLCSVFKLKGKLG
nr:MAG TPA: integrase [Caudoviricetes sp.]